MDELRNISRKQFLKNIGLVSGAFVIGGSFFACGGKETEEDQTQSGKDEGVPFTPNLFIQLKKDGSLILLASRSEMGQGVRTSLTSILADEMEADWGRVTVKQAIGNEKLGDQNTDGSRSIRMFYEPMRRMGATAKAMLLTAAAKYWSVPEEECYAQKHFVHHKDGRKVPFGDLVEIASQLIVPEKISLKDPKDFQYIGKQLPGVDVTKFTDGSAIFGLDARLPGMKFAVIARCPVTFGKVKSYDAAAALKIPGVEKVLEIPRLEKPFGNLGGVAVIASNTWSAIKGKEALDITWDLGENQSYSSPAYMDELIRNVQKEGIEVRQEGNVKTAFKKAHQIVESTFQAPHLVHAPMEVPNALAWVKAGECIVYAPTQSPQGAQEEVAEFLGIPKEKVTIHVTFLGGGFGRKSKPDFIIEAVTLSRELKAPVQVIWTREDDIRHSYYHACSAQYLKAALDQNGKVTAWLHRTAYPSINSTFQAGVTHAAGFETGQGLSNLPFDIENLQIENGEAKAHVRIGWLRSVYNIIHALSINAFVDELAAKAGKDPLEFYLDLIGRDRIITADKENEPGYEFNTARLKNVLTKVTQNAGWGKPMSEGFGLGLALHYSFSTYMATVAEVSVIENKLRIHNLHYVIDCGRTVNQDTIKAQLEGSAIFGMSIVKYGKITTLNGAVEQSNFHNYPLTRMNEAPNVHVEIINSDEAPSGVGEPGVPPTPPAILNAIAAATGKRYYRLPLTDMGLE